VEEFDLLVEPRHVLGKKVKALRRQGITPANVYGNKVESQAVQVDTKMVFQTLRQLGRNSILSLRVEGERTRRPVMVRDIQRHSVTDELLHLDFYQISLTEKMHADVTVILRGFSPAVSEQGGILVQPLETVSVEALPAEIPPQIEVDASQLQELDAAIRVRDLEAPPGVLILTDPDVVVARVAAPRVVEEEVAVKEEEAVEERAEAAEEKEGE
jgi:large subunit ribosomal protein L25